MIVNMTQQAREDVLGRIEDVRRSMPWSDERDDLLEELYEELDALDGL